MTKLFGHPELIKKNKRLAELAKLADFYKKTDKKYKVEVSYEISETYYSEDKKIVTVMAQNEEDAKNIAMDQIDEAVTEEIDENATDYEIIITDTKIKKITYPNQEKDNKTLDLQLYVKNKKARKT